MKNRLTLTLAACLALAALPACNKQENAKTTAAEPKTAAPAPFTGEVHDVKMRGTATGFYFEPKEVTLKHGDKVRFSMIDGGPHNVNFASPAFSSDTKVPEGAKVRLETAGKLIGPLLQMPGQTFEIVFGNDLPTGEYTFVCDPHAPLGMKGKITVTP